MGTFSKKKGFGDWDKETLTFERVPDPQMELQTLIRDPGIAKRGHGPNQLEGMSPSMSRISDPPRLRKWPLVGLIIRPARQETPIISAPGHASRVMSVGVDSGDL